VEELAAAGIAVTPRDVPAEGFWARQAALELRQCA